MKLSQRTLALVLLLGGALGAHAQIVLLPNGDFESGDSGANTITDWTPIDGDGTFAYSYNDDGGPAGIGDGFAEIDNPDSLGFGILISNNNTELSLASFGAGLLPGKTYTFSVDMKNTVPGTGAVGGLKVDFFTGTTANGSTGDIFPALIGDGSTWETYNFDVQIPSGTDGLKVVLLWGAGQKVGFDNATVETTPVPFPTDIPNKDFEIAMGDSWGFNDDLGAVTITFPATGGSPSGSGGYAQIDDSFPIGGFGILVSNSDGILQLCELGLTPGETYKFSLDMANLGGVPDKVGGLKVDFFNGAAADGSTGDEFATFASTGSDWATYDFNVAIPLSTTAIKVVPLWGAEAIVGYDNVTFDPTPLVVAPITEVPNKGFEDTPAGDTWDTDSGGGTFVYDFPTTGGSTLGADPNAGYASIDNTDGAGFGVLVANSGNIIPLSGLGLTPGEAYRFSMDMIVLTGTDLGGLKLEFYNGATLVSDTGDMRPADIAPVTSWQTYDFDRPIPAGADGMKFVPLWGVNSKVGYDNVCFDTTPIVVEPVTIINADFEEGDLGWAMFKGGNTTFTFPSTGGSTLGSSPGGGYAQIDNFDGFAVLVANGNSIIPAANLGLAAGDTATFTMDMRVEFGSNIGGLKIEFYNGAAGNGDTGDMPGIPVGLITDWQTYSWDVTLPANTNGIKIVPLWGDASTVCYDNVAVIPPSGSNDFGDWIGGFPGVGGSTGFLDDPDGDGNESGLENFFGTDPSVFTAGLVAGTVSGNTFTFTHAQNATPADDVSAPAYSWSTDLDTFYADGAPNGAGTTTVSFSAAVDTPTAGTTTVTATITGTVIPTKLFVNVSVTQTS